MVTRGSHQYFRTFEKFGNLLLGSWPWYAAQPKYIAFMHVLLFAHYALEIVKRCGQYCKFDK